MSDEIFIPIKMGMLGMSIDDISHGKQGWVKLPLGGRDATMAGGRVWVRVKVTALEDVRANRDIIVANEQGDIKEHTPVELSYEKSEGGYQRVGANYPLPVTAGSKAVIYVSKLCTAIENTELIAGVSGQNIRVHYFSYSNKHAATVDVAMRFAGAGDLKHRHVLAGDGGNVNANLIDCCWESEEGEALNAYLAAAYAGGVYFNIGYTLE